MASDRSNGHSHEHGDQADSKEPTTNATPGSSPPRNQLDSSPPSADTIQSSPNGKHASVNEVKPLPPPPGQRLSPCTRGMANYSHDGLFSMCNVWADCRDIGRRADQLCSGQFPVHVHGSSSVHLLGVGGNYRSKLREKYNLVEAPAEDWVLHLFCSCCALCQEFRELQNRGIDPSLGIKTILSRASDSRMWVIVCRLDGTSCSEARGKDCSSPDPIHERMRSLWKFIFSCLLLV
uniref:Uncharacterized protein n=1 Tax=Ananas comosus var. bracteatus TaxID=296719 RepID=A0A6V7PUM0_ANACO|nr:unnamed protein product [Ananas comosus var. bracteatus]